MKRLSLVFVGLSLSLASCSGVQTPQEAADEYCALIVKAALATPDENEKLLKEVEDFENKIEKEHEGDETWFQEFEEKMESTCL